MTPTKMITSFIAVTILSLASHANGAESVTTLYQVDRPTPTVASTGAPEFSIEYGAETKYSYIGPAQETGVGRYGVQEVISRYVLHGNDNNPTQTVISEPVTRTWLMEQGPSVIRQDVPGFVTVLPDAGGSPFWITGGKENCKLDMEKKEGVCVDEMEIPVPSAINTQGSSTVYSTFTSKVGATTYTGSLHPVATVTATSTGGASEMVASMMVLVSATLMTGFALL